MRRARPPKTRSVPRSSVLQPFLCVSAISRVRSFASVPPARGSDLYETVRCFASNGGSSRPPRIVLYLGGLAADGGLHSGSHSLQLGRPVAQFAVSDPRLWFGFEVAPDGQRFLAMVPQIRAGDQPLTVVLNWPAALPK